MARTPGTEHVLAAAALWKERSLLGRSSVFSSEQLWTKNLLDELQDHFVENPRSGELSFSEKLRQQLEEAPEPARRLAAEMLWVMFLFPAAKTMGADTKREAVRDVWEWGGTSLPENEQLLGRALQVGIGSAGQAFHNLRWAELGFFIAFLRRWVTREPSEQQRLSKDPWQFARFLDGTPDADRRQLRHMLLHLLYPDSFERISSRDNRERIVAAFEKQMPELTGIDEASDSPMLRIDRQLLAIRRKAEASHPRVFLDFYRPPLLEIWKPVQTPSATGGDELTNLPPVAQSLENVLRSYLQARTEPFGGSHPVAVEFRQIERAVAKITGKSSASRLQVRASVGQGNWARIPWIAVMDPRETLTTQHGVYVVFLFREDMSGVYLTLNQGVTEPRQRLGTVRARHELRARAQQLRGRARFLSDHGYSLDDDIDLHATGNLGSQYEDSTVAYKFYQAGRVPPDEEITRDLHAVLRAYEGYMETADLTPEPGSGDQRASGAVITTPPETPATRAAIMAAADDFSTAVLGTGLRLERDFVRAFIVSLLTKRFVILTGLSGSGKTQLALKFGEWLGSGRHLIVAVRPDWTGPESLLGYEDALLPTTAAGARAWHVPAALEFLITATNDPHSPFALVLDEMNLAHVERYFADFLSGMESGAAALPNLNNELGLWSAKSNAPRQIPFPANVFVVGTVNVDETTYAFSPKVLDRANTLEFRVGTADLGAAPVKPSMATAATEASLDALLRVSGDDTWHVTNPGNDGAIYQEHLKKLHEVLSMGNLEFGHRMFYEAVRFHSIHDAIGGAGWEASLDLQVLQKVLPRLSGSRKRLEPTLLRLLVFCRSLEVPADLTTHESLDEGAEHAPPRLPRSYSRVTRLLRSLRANQFASFAE